LPILLRLILAVSAGVFIGLERERQRKAGLRTFAFAALLGCMGAVLGDAYALLVLGFLVVQAAFMNWRYWQKNQSLELTTTSALIVTGFIGILCGKGHTFTPVAATVFSAALLAWKQPLSGFVLGLRESELRSAILLAILSFVIYPVLPDHAVDPWGLFEPRSTWGTVILIAVLGFVNYLLWRLYGTRGVEITGFLGGLVNSTAAVAELAARVKEAGERLINSAFRGIMLATTAMVLRNAILLALLSPQVIPYAALSFALMFASSAVLAWRRIRIPAAVSGAEAMPPLQLESPFSLTAALKFGLLFMALQMAGTLGQRYLGMFGFYAVCLAGGLFSSASAVASAATLCAHHELSPAVAANGAILASLMSVIVNLPLVLRVGGQRKLTIALVWALGFVALAGLAGVVFHSRNLF
jgi:uncharacterized membrane protein (DUF4010 family)